MRNKFALLYGIVAFIAIILSVVWFAVSLGTAVRDGTEEAQRSFSWLSREAVNSSLEKGFLSGPFIEDLTALCRKSRLLSALMVETPAGAVFVWPDNSRFISIGSDGKPLVASTDVFQKVFGASLDIGDSAGGAVRMTAVISVLQPGAVFSASRNSFMVVLAVLLVTFIVIIVYQPEPARRVSIDDALNLADSEFTLEGHPEKPDDAVEVGPGRFEEITAAEARLDASAYGTGVQSGRAADANGVDAGNLRARNEAPLDEADFAAEPGAARDEGERNEIKPEGLFSPITGIGWEQYLAERLDAELVRAASSEQDLALVILRVPGLRHTDLLARRIAAMLLEIFSFRDMLFEYGQDGFAGILQNVNLDLAMKNAERLFARIDETLLELSSDSRIAIGITTRTARLLPAARMIQEASSAAKKAQDEPNLPIVAFRANPEKYRAFVAENGPEAT